MVINRIRVARSNRTVDAMVALCGFEDMVVWQRRIQPFIARTKGIGSDWDWPAYFLGCSLVEELMGRAAFAFQIRVERPDGGAVPVGQAICSLNYFFPMDKTKRCVFAWFLAATPEDALRAYGIQDRFAVMAPLLDAVVQLSIANGQQGRVGLHAAAGPTSEQSDELLQRYRRYGLKNRPIRHGFFRFPFRRDDGRFFYFDSADALAFAAQQDDLR